jgi:hypothetical protein
MLLQHGIQAARQGRRIEARELFLRVVEAQPNNETAWMWLIDLVDSPEDQIIACEHVVAINPSNEEIRARLYRLLRQQGGGIARSAGHPEAGTFHRPPARSDPPSTKPDLRGLSHQREAEGNLEAAIRALADLASTTRNAPEFDQIYREIARLESLQKEQIVHIAPGSHILRMTLSWPMLYIFLALIQSGLSPFGNAAWILWAGKKIASDRASPGLPLQPPAGLWWPCLMCSYCLLR